MSENVWLVTGAGRGMGVHIVKAALAADHAVVATGRNPEKVGSVLGAHDDLLVVALDVTDPNAADIAVQAAVERFGRIDVLVNNAGGALGLGPIEKALDDEWIGMWNVNVLGLMWMTRACLPLIRKAKHGHVINIGSVAGFETYKGGAGYTAAKHAVRAITRTLRLELNGEPIRVTEIDPGLVETEFSLVRFHGDRKAAKAVYEGLKPLTAEDIAECVIFAVTRPPHVDIDEIVVRPVAQATTWMVARKPKR
jgi:NADP-dependent 3-hydroxy acid dehydrogenase YdfG